MVLDPSGKAVTEAATAEREPALTLKFRDGLLDVFPTRGAPAPPRKGTAPSPPSGPDRQPKLL